MIPAKSALHRRSRRRVLVGALAAAVLATGAAAGEPLFLRIRPRPDPSGESGAAGSFEAARAAREAAFARSNARAWAIIASVCTGCLAPRRSEAAAPSAAAKADERTRLASAGAPADTGAAGLEPDPPVGASEPTSEPEIRERGP